MERPFDVDGSVVFEAAKGVKPPPPAGPGFHPAGRQAFESPKVFMRNDGRFQARQVFPGRYQVSLHPAPGYYFAGIEYGGAAVDGRVVTLAPGDAALKLIYRQGGGVLNGSVEKCGGGWVGLFAQIEPGGAPVSNAVARCDAHDRYEIRDLAPGQYFAAAYRIDPINPLWRPGNEVFDPNLAVSVTIRAGETVNMDLRAGNRPMF
jgi:hypothetical protein